MLPDLEAALLPLGARPHWGKCFAATAADLEPLYPRLGDFRALRDRVDPDRDVRQRVPRPSDRLTHWDGARSVGIPTAAARFRHPRGR